MWRKERKRRKGDVAKAEFEEKRERWQGSSHERGEMARMAIRKMRHGKNGAKKEERWQEWRLERKEMARLAIRKKIDGKNGD